MKGGLAMIVAGISSRGTLTTDTYSLNGFPAAYDAIPRAREVDCSLVLTFTVSRTHRR